MKTVEATEAGMVCSSTSNSPRTPSSRRVAERGSDDGGFTLIEVMMVVLVLGILMTITTPTLLGARERAWDLDARSSLRNSMSTAILLSEFRSDFTFAPAAALTAAEPTYTYVDASEASTGPKVVSVDASSPSRWAAAVMSASGTCFAAVVEGGGEVQVESESCAAADIDADVPEPVGGTGGSTATTTEPMLIENIASHSTVSMISLYRPETVASRMVDGNTNGSWSWSGNVLAHSGLATNPWAGFDLPNAAYIDSISIWNRTDCCAGRATNVWVFVSDTPISNDLATAQASGARSVNIPGQVGTPSTVAIGATGRYIKIFINGRTYLHFAEVQINGDLTP